MAVIVEVCIVHRRRGLSLDGDIMSLIADVLLSDHMLGDTYLRWVWVLGELSASGASDHE